MARRRWILGMVALMLLGGCGSRDGTAPIGEGGDQMHQQALEALARYDQAVLNAGGRPSFTPVGELTGMVGEWGGQTAENGKVALLAGMVKAIAPMPAAPQPTGQVVWADGTTKELPLISADEALRELRAAAVSAGGGDCGGCAPLEATAARLSTATIRTTRGTATVPAWEYTLKDTSARLTRAAVSPSATITVTPPPWDSLNTPAGMSIESASTSQPGTRLTVGFVGAPGPGSQPCGADYTAEAVESTNAVVVIVYSHPHGPGETCTAIGAERTATVDLAAPLGDRAVLEVRQGLPVAVAFTG